MAKDIVITEHRLEVGTPYMWKHLIRTDVSHFKWNMQLTPYDPTKAS